MVLYPLTNVSGGQFQIYKDTHRKEPLTGDDLNTAVNGNPDNRRFIKIEFDKDDASYNEFWQAIENITGYNSSKYLFNNGFYGLEKIFNDNLGQNNGSY